MSKHSAQGTHCSRLLAFAFATLAMLPAVEATAADELKIGGTGNALGTVRLLGEGFVNANPGSKVTILPSLGTSGAFKAVPKGAIDIGLSSRPLTEEERKLGLTAIEFARTPLVFAVALKTQVKSLTLDQIADVYSGKMASWPDGSQVRPVLRQIGDDNTRQVKAMSPAIDKALTAAEQRPGMPFATTDQEAADKTESVPGALGATTLALILSENRSLRPLALNGVEPTVVNVTSGTYPHVKHLFLVTKADASPGVKRFIAFIQSPAGREILMRAGSGPP